MSLRSRVALVRGAFWPAVIVLTTALAVLGIAAGLVSVSLFVVTCAGPLALTVGWPRLARRLLGGIARRHQERIDAALADGDEDSRRRLLAETEEYYRALVPQAEQQLLRLRCHGLAAEERWSEAQALLAQIDRARIPTAERVSHDNLVAWCCAHAGETARAVELAQAAMNAPVDAQRRPYLLGTLGAALVLDGQPAAALTPLREALAAGGPRWAQAVRRYYLGEALAALGRLDEAQAEWRQAVTIAPRSRHGRRAQARLEAGAPAAYR